MCVCLSLFLSLSLYDILLCVCIYIGEVKENAQDVIADIVRSREYAELEAAEDGVGVMTLYDGKGEGEAPAELVLPLKIFEAEQDEALLVLDALQLMLEHSSPVLTLLALLVQILTPYLLY